MNKEGKFEALERYKDVTDLQALNAASSKPLRKSVRINTLKTSVEDFKSWAKQHNWYLEPVPWCNEAFFVDREDRSEGIGKSLLHLLGHMYVQEASSMLPVELLDPQPGEFILDMSAAPGSKTTQIGAKLQGRGVVVANDIQEKRLQTLKTALHRSGVHNNFTTKHMGQWFGQNMVGRFDRVLCDAPCTAQGTVRKDPTALSYSSDLGIEKAASIQKDLLESAIHSTKIGGRIVYSTCTLTPEENEEVVEWALKKYKGKLLVVDPTTLGLRTSDFGQAIRDSVSVQEKFISESGISNPEVRIWPQTYDTEGFFCAVLQKTDATKEIVERKNPEKFQEKPLRNREMGVFQRQLEDQFGTSFMRPEDHLFQLEDQLVLSTRGVENLIVPTHDYFLGIPFGKVLKNGVIRINNDLVIDRGHMAIKQVMHVADDVIDDVLSGKDIQCPADLHGDTVVMWNGVSIGLGLAKSGKLLNRLSRWLVQHRSS